MQEETKKVDENHPYGGEEVTNTPDNEVGETSGTQEEIPTTEETVTE